MTADETHAPGERFTAATGDARLDERVEHLPLGQPEPGHDRHAGVGEQFLTLGARGAPGDLPPEPGFGLGGDVHPLFTGGFPVAADASGEGHLASVVAEVGWHVRRRYRPDDHDLVSIDLHRQRPGVHPIGHAADEPRTYRLSFHSANVIAIT